MRALGSREKGVQRQAIWAVSGAVRHVCVCVCVLTRHPQPAPYCVPDLSRQSLTTPLFVTSSNTLHNCQTPKTCNRNWLRKCTKYLCTRTRKRTLTLPFTLPFAFTLAFDFYGCELCMKVAIVGYSFDRQRVLGTVEGRGITPRAPPGFPTFIAYRDGKI